MSRPDRLKTSMIKQVMMQECMNAEPKVHHAPSPSVASRPKIPTGGNKTMLRWSADENSVGNQPTSGSPSGDGMKDHTILRMECREVLIESPKEIPCFI